MRLSRSSLGEDVETCAFTVVTPMASSVAMLRVRPARRDRQGHLVLARGEGGQRGAGPLVGAGLGDGALHQPAGDARGQDRVARGDPGDGFHDLRGRGVLEQEAAGTGAQRVQDVLVGVEGGQHDHLGRTGAGAQPAGGGDAVHPRHAQVHQDDVGGVGVGRR